MTEKEKRMDEEVYWERIRRLAKNKSPEETRRLVTAGLSMIKSTSELIKTLTNNGREFTQAVIDKSRAYRLQGMKQCDIFYLNRLLNEINFLSDIFDDMRIMIHRELETKKETDTLDTP